MSDTLYEYTFQVVAPRTWVLSDNEAEWALKLFTEHFHHPATMRFTEERFAVFRRGLAHLGLIVRDVTRVLYQLPEIID